LWIIHLVYPFR